MKSITGGNFVYADGTPVANGKVTFQLSQDATVIAGGQASSAVVSWPLDASGNLVSGAQILANDEITPSGTTYTVNVYDANGALVYGAAIYNIIGSSPIDIGNLYPVNITVTLDGPAPDVYFIDLLNGSFTFADGTPVSNGVVTFELQLDQDLTSGGHISRHPISFDLDASGNIVAGAGVFTNDGVVNDSSLYTVSVYSSTGALVQGPLLYYMDTAQSRYSTMDLSTMGPNSSNVYVRAGGTTPPTPQNITIYPTTGTVQAQNEIQFTASVSGVTASAITWSVDGIPGGSTDVGTITVNGLYLAPLTAGVHTITAAFTQIPSLFATAQVTVQLTQVNVQVTISPTTVTMAKGASQQFAATVTGTSDTSVDWYVNDILGGSTGPDPGQGGTITSGTTTLTVQTPIITTNSIEIKATASDTSAPLTGLAVYLDGSGVAAASQVGSGPYDVTVTGLSAGKHSVSVVVSNYLSNIASFVIQTTVGTSNTGTIDTTGKYTAPTSGGGAFTIKAQSHAVPAASATATVSVDSGISVAVAPTDFVVQTSQTTQLAATVSGSTNTAVVWSVDGISGGNSSVGTVSSSGLYTAPTGAGTHTVTATSVADNTKSGNANCTVVTGAAVAVQISPTNPQISVAQSQQFTATVAGTANQNVTWQVNGVTGGNNTYGTITTGGLYIAPGLTGSPGSGGTVTSNTLTMTVKNPTLSGNTLYISASGVDTKYVVTSFQIYLDGSTVPTNYGGTGPFNVQVQGLSTGTHQVACKMWNSNGNSCLLTITTVISSPSTGEYQITAISAADTSKSSTTNIFVGITATPTPSPTGGPSTVTGLMAHNTSANVAYNQANYGANFGPYTCDTQINAVYPPNASCGFAIDPSQQDMSQNPITPGHVSNVDVHTLIPSRPDLRWFTHWVPWFSTGAGRSQSHIDIGVTCNSTQWVQAAVTDQCNRGFDGCIIDWYGSGSYENNATLKLQAYLASTKAVTKAGGTFKYCIMIDNIYTDTASLLSVVQYVQKQYWSDPNYETENGKPLLFFFQWKSTVDYASVKAQTGGYWIFLGSGLVTNSAVDGVYSWSADYHSGPSSTDPYNLAGVKSYYSSLINSKTSKHCVGSMNGGFNGTLTKKVSWSLGKYTPRDGGKCVVQWANTINSVIPSFVTRMQWVTLNDWEEGSSIEAGVENNCVINASISGSTISWTVSFTSGANQGNETTIDHYEIYGTTDGVNATSYGTVATGGRSFNLAGLNLVHGTTYTFYVKAVARPCIRDHISLPVTYTA